MLLLLFDRIVGAWKLKLGKNITHHYLPKSLTILFLLPVIAILVNELLRKIIKYQVIIFTQRILGKRKLRFLGGPHVVVEQRKLFLVAFTFDYKYLDSGHTRPPVLEK